MLGRTPVVGVAERIDVRRFAARADHLPARIGLILREHDHRVPERRQRSLNVGQHGFRADRALGDVHEVRAFVLQLAHRSTVINDLHVAIERALREREIAMP